MLRTVTILTFLCVDPYFILDWPQTSKDFSFLQIIYRNWNGGDTPAGLGTTMAVLAGDAGRFRRRLEIFLLAAMLWVIARPKPGTYALIAFILACFWSLTSGHPQLEFRYLVNPLLAMALVGGLFANDLVVLASEVLGSRIGLAVAAGAGLALLAPSLIQRPANLIGFSAGGYANNSPGLDTLSITFHPAVRSLCSMDSPMGNPRCRASVPNV